jgi:hypothetical protein
MSKKGITIGIVLKSELIAMVLLLLIAVTASAQLKLEADLGVNVMSISDPIMESVLYSDGIEVGDFETDLYRSSIWKALS